MPKQIWTQIIIPSSPPPSYQRKGSLKYPCNPQVRFYLCAQMLALSFTGFSISQRAEEAAPSSQVETRGADRSRDPLAHPCLSDPAVLTPTQVQVQRSCACASLDPTRYPTLSLPLASEGTRGSLEARRGKSHARAPRAFVFRGDAASGGRTENRREARLPDYLLLTNQPVAQVVRKTQHFPGILPLGSGAHRDQRFPHAVHLPAATENGLFCRG